MQHTDNPLFSIGDIMVLINRKRFCAEALSDSNGFAVRNGTPQVDLAPPPLIARLVRLASNMQHAHVHVTGRLP